MIQDGHLYSSNADACESLDLVEARRLDSLDTSWFAVTFTEGDLARLVEFSIGMLGGGARLVCRPYTEQTELRRVEHAEFRRVRTELSRAAVKMRT